MENSSHRNDYPNYQEELDNYERINGRSDEWNPVVNNNLNLNKSKLTKDNDRHHEDIEIKLQQQAQQLYNSKKSCQQGSDLPIDPKKSNIVLSQYLQISNQQLHEQLSSMRNKFQLMNKQLNMMLDRYQLALQKIQKTEPNYGAPKVLEKQINLNTKIIDSQQKQIRKIHQMQINLKERDLMMQIQKTIDKTKQGIHSCHHEKHLQRAAVDKLDRLILQVKQLQDTDQDFKIIQGIKYQRLYYENKQKEQTQIQKDLQKQIQTLKNMENQINQQFIIHKKIAQDKFLPVSTNQSLVKYKIQFETLKNRIEQVKKKKDIENYSQVVNQNKIAHEIKVLKKQSQLVNFEINQLDNRCSQLQNQIDGYIKQNKLDDLNLQTLVYKYDDISNHNHYKPNFKSYKLQKQRQFSKAYHSIEIDKLQRSDLTHETTLNHNLRKPIMKTSSHKMPHIKQQIKTSQKQSIFSKPNLLLRKGK